MTGPARPGAVLLPGEREAFAHVWKRSVCLRGPAPVMDWTPGSSFYGSLDPLCVDKGSAATVGEKEWVCFVDSQVLLPPRGHGPKCQTNHQEQKKSEK